MKGMVRGLLLLLAVLLTGWMLPVPAAGEETPQICCTALVEAQTGICLGGNEPERRTAIGSQTKLMTVYLTAEAAASGGLKLDEAITVSPAAEHAPGATVWLLAGERMTVGDLLKAVIIGNANDACIALACRISGTEKQFVAEMNAAAISLGMRHTRFADCTGLSAENESTAQELGLLCRALLQYDFLTPMFKTWRDFLRGGGTELVSENRLTKGYEGLLGMKAGHGETSGYTLTAAAEQEGLCMIAVVLGCDDPDARFTKAKTMLKEGFTGYYVTTPEDPAEFMRPVRVRYGTADAVLIASGELLSAAIPKGEQLSSVIVLPRWVDAPVQQGEKIGTAAVYCADTLIYETPLIAAEDVPRRTFRDALQMLLRALFRGRRNQQ